jgi:hypothetical protein
MKKDKTTIYAEQYLECSANNQGSWDVHLVIENITEEGRDESSRLKYLMGNFRTMIDGDNFAESLRYFYDRSVYKFECV